MQFARFLLVGACNTLIGLSCIFLTMWLFDVDYRLANAVGYSAGCVVGFLLNRSWTFQHQGGWWSSLVRWLAVVVLAYSINLLAVIGLHQEAGIGIYAAQVGGVAVYTILAFLGGRFFAFSPPKPVLIGGATRQL